MKRAATIVWVLACACGAPAKQQPVAAPPPPPPAPVVEAPPPPPPPPPPEYHSGVDECDQVIVAYERLFSCDQIKTMPPESIAAMRQGLQTMKDSWHFDNDEAKAAAKTGCQAALDGLRQGAQAMGCPLPP